MSYFCIIYSSNLGLHTQAIMGNMHHFLELLCFTIMYYNSIHLLGLRTTAVMGNMHHFLRIISSLETNTSL